MSLLRIFEYQKKKSLLYFMCFQLPTILHLYIQPEKTMKHFVVLRFQKVNMCRDGLSLSLPFFFLYVILNTCVRMWCLSGWFVCLIDRERERLREREEFCGYKKISNTKKMKKDILFRCRSLLHIRQRYTSANEHIGVRRERKSQIYRTICPSPPV